jgi:hypothetical protein
MIVGFASALSLLSCSARLPFRVLLRSPHRKIVPFLFQALLANSAFLLVVNDNLAVPGFISALFPFLPVFTSFPTQLRYMTEQSLPVFQVKSNCALSFFLSQFI